MAADVLKGNKNRKKRETLTCTYIFNTMLLNVFIFSQPVQSQTVWCRLGENERWEISK